MKVLKDTMPDLLDHVPWHFAFGAKKILLPKGNASDWNGFGVRDPAPLMDENGFLARKNGALWMYHTGSRLPDGKIQSTGLAFSQDEGESWSPHDGPVLTPDPENWDSVCAATPWAMQREDGRILLYYRGASGYDNGQAIGIAESRDGINFTRLSDKPILTHRDFPGMPQEGPYSLGVVNVCKILDGRFLLTFEGSCAADDGRYAIFAAISDDGISFKPFNYGQPIFRGRDSKNWTIQCAANPRLIALEKKRAYLLTYDGHNGDGAFTLGLAYSMDLLHWQDHPLNPVMVPAGEAHDPFSGRLEGACLVKEDLLDDKKSIRCFFMAIPKEGPSHKNGVIALSHGERFEGERPPVRLVASTPAPERSFLKKIKALPLREQILFFLHPVFMLAGNARALAITYWESLKIIGKPAQDWGRYSPYLSFLNSFHVAYDWFIERYGRGGYIYEAGIGCPAAPLFHITRLSCALYPRFQTLMPTICMALMQLGFLMFILQPGISAGSVLLTVALGFISTYFYYFTFDGLKYDAMGWVVVPLGYLAIYLNAPLLFAAAFFFMTLTSINAALVQGAVWGLWSALTFNIPFIFAFVPGGILIALHFLYLLEKTGLQELAATASLIGTNKQGRSKRPVSFAFRDWHLMATCGVFAFVYGWQADVSVDLLFLGLAVGLYTYNKLGRRFADRQTVIAAIFAALTYLALQQPIGWIHVFYWLAVSPMPALIGFTVQKPFRAQVWKPAALKPYYKKPLDETVHEFLKPALGSGRVLFDCVYRAGRHPDFGGFKAFREALHLQLMMAGTGLIPDYYVAKDQYAGKFDLESLMADSTPAGRMNAMESLGCRYLILPSATKTPDASWTDFKLLKSLDLQSLKKQGLLDEGCFPAQKPYLHLLDAGESYGSLAARGVLLEKNPNTLRVRLDGEGMAVICYAYDPRWISQESVKISAYRKDMEWIAIQGKPSADVTLSFRPLAYSPRWLMDWI